MLSVSEGRQINTTKHFGGGVNVSAGATLLIKAGALSLSHKFIHTHTHTHGDRFEPPTFTNNMGSWRSKGCCC